MYLQVVSLTLTKVVFEFFNSTLLINLGYRLTLTKVVFEFS